MFLFSLPITLFHLPGYLLWARFREHPCSIFIFPSVMVVMEWIQYSFTPFASWGVAAYSQAHSIVLMQTVSLLGMPGLSFLVYWTNVSLAAMMIKRKATPATFHIPVAVLLVLVLFGALRYELSKSRGRETMKVAAVGTDSRVSGYPLPSRDSIKKVNTGLFRRTELAAAGHARLIVWNEAATVILPSEELAWRDSLSALSKRLGISLVASYILPLSESPVKYENKFVFFDSTGLLVNTYLKHQPVPAEPAVKGQGPLKLTKVGGCKVGGVICYDYDFPYLAKAYGKQKADLVADPSSDWRGIDPLHSRMAAFRAVEQGHSVLRSTRFGLSAAITPYGEMITQIGSFDSNDKVMMALLPVKAITTLYSVIGDMVVYLCLGFIVFFFLNVYRKAKSPAVNGLLR
jgi:apolipoprotein N-acyltransferase